MSGHSKWSTIKRKKGALDNKRAKVFTKILKEVSVAVKEGGPDAEANPRLRLAVNNAKGMNMPKDTLMRAINKASDKSSASLQEVAFECYAPHGIAIFVECLTDNNMRTVANVRSVFNKYNGTLGTNGSLSFIFDRKGVFTIPKKEIDADALEMELIDAGAEEIEQDDDYITVYTAMEDFGAMSRKLDEMSIEVENASLQRIPKTTEEIDVESAQKVLKIVEILEDDDDVQAVYHNMEIPEELMNE